MEDVFIKRWSEDTHELTIMLYASRFFGHKERLDMPPGVDEGVIAFMRTLGVTADDEHRQKLKSLVPYLKRHPRHSVQFGICKHFIPERLFKEGFHKEAIMLRNETSSLSDAHQIIVRFSEQLFLYRGKNRWLSAMNTLSVASHPQFSKTQGKLLAVTAMNEVMDYDRPTEWKDALKTLEVCLGLRTRYPSIIKDEWRVER